MIRFQTPFFSSSEGIQIPSCTFCFHPLCSADVIYIVIHNSGQIADQNDNGVIPLCHSAVTPYFLRLLQIELT